MSRSETYYQFYVLYTERGGQGDERIRVSSPGYHVIRSTWIGSRIFNSQVVASFPDTPEGRLNASRECQCQRAADAAS